MLPFRNTATKPQYKKEFGADIWEKLFRASVDFNYKMMKRSPIILLVGKHVHLAFMIKLKTDPALRMEKVFLNFTTKIFGQRTCFYLAYDTISQQLKQVIFSFPYASLFFPTTPRYPQLSTWM